MASSGSVPATHFLSPVGPSVTGRGGAGPGCRHAEAGQLRPVSGNRLLTESEHNGDHAGPNGKQPQRGGQASSHGAESGRDKTQEP